MTNKHKGETKVLSILCYRYNQVKSSPSTAIFERVTKVYPSDERFCYFVPANIILNISITRHKNLDPFTYKWVNFHLF
ncbi:hypothetical protein Hanom_Chr01g00012761 [Helianthus anomalus]